MEQQRPCTGSGHALVSSEAALVPELHGQADHLWPSARSMAATVEESTPPDMATAMVVLDIGFWFQARASGSTASCAYELDC